MIGRTLIQYEIVGQLGVGGMGEVYRARDTQLGREVAIKVLPDAFSRDADRLARFEREARLLASLNHPGIATLYGFEADGETRFIVMELVEGRTLSERIASGSVSLEEALPIFARIAEGLEAAHDKNVTHRDLKPANIKITPDGTPKILDFGLAKALDEDHDSKGDVDSSLSPTLTKGTGVGAILGTAAYMSPEQARGRRVDKRTDIWAFGCCLYEAVTGRKPFDGETATDTIAAVIGKEPELDRVPVAVRPLVARCLEKDARQRLRDIGEARIALTSGDVGVQAASTPSKPIALALVGMVVAALAGWSLAPSPRATNGGVSRVEISIDGTFDMDDSRTPTPFVLSPDGRTIAYAATKNGVERLHVRAFDTLESRALPGTEGAAAPFFSPDGEWVGFVAGGKLQRIALAGGLPVTICPAPQMPVGASWGRDGRIAFASGMTSGILRVDENGGEPETLVPVDREAGELGLRWPHLTEDGVIYVVQKGGGTVETAMYRFDTEASKLLVEGAHYARYASSGHLVYGRDDGVQTTLFAAPFDTDRAEVTGAAVPVLENVYRSPGGGGSFFSISRTGTLVYVRDRRDKELVWVDRRGVVTPVTDEPGDYMTPRLSADGEKLAYPDSFRVLVRDLVRGGTSLLANGGAMVSFRPRSRELTFMRTVPFDVRIFITNTDGSTTPTQLLETTLPQTPNSWSPDGTTLLFVQGHPETGYDLWYVRPGAEPRPFLVTPAHERAAVFSPDGRYVAYVSNESGQNEVYVRPFPSGDRKWIVSTGGGREPKWSPIGNELFYTSDSKMMAVEIETSSEFRAGAPTFLFDADFAVTFASEFFASYDVSPDGQRFVMVRGDPEDKRRLHVIFDWFTELSRLAPVPG